MKCLSHSLLRWIIILGVCNSICYTPSVLALDKSTEDKIKAAYTYQFTKFVTWPEQTSPGVPFSICVIGNESIRKELEPLNQRKIGERTISVNYISSVANIKNCNILYISKSERHKLKEILRYITGKPVLTVSSIDDFASQGGIIGLVTYNKKIRLEINLASARQVDIKLSAKLLEIASVVEGSSVREEQP